MRSSAASLIIQHEKSETNIETTANLRLLYGAWLKASRGTEAWCHREVRAVRFKGMRKQRPSAVADAGSPARAHEDGEDHRAV